MYRQAVISVSAPLPDGSHSKDPYYIFFRQPYNDLGLALSFSFTKSYFAPFSDCTLTIQNVGNEIVDQFKFDPNDYTKRPLVKIYAGYTDKKIKKYSEAKNLISNLQEVFTGFPFFWKDQKITGGRLLEVNLKDMAPGARLGKFTKSFGKGTTLAKIISECLRGVGIFTFNYSEGTFDYLNSISIDNPLMFNNRSVLNDIIPSLGKQYEFTSHIDKVGTYIFTRMNTLVKSATAKKTVVSAENGMIEQPSPVNFTQWNVKTLYGLPKILHPGNFIRVDSPSLKRIKYNNTDSKQEGLLDGLVVEGEYNFNDEDAEISYLISAEGQPINSQKVKNI